MDLHEYKARNGFKDEAALLREIGERTISLNRILHCRPARKAELDAINALAAAVETLNLEIARTSCDESL